MKSLLAINSKNIISFNNFEITKYHVKIIHIPLLIILPEISSSLHSADSTICLKQFEVENFACNNNEVIIQFMFYL